MTIREFSAAKDLDYVRGTRRGWQRQIAFVKDGNPLGPNYFVIADTLNAESVPTIWRLYLSAAQITPNAGGATLIGKEDVDLDLFFLRPAPVKLEVKADHVSVALDAGGTLSAVLYPRLKTEPAPQVTAMAAGKGV